VCAGQANRRLLHPAQLGAAEQRGDDYVFDQMMRTVTGETDPAKQNAALEYHLNGLFGK
jgi:hypothetical protein